MRTLYYKSLFTASALALGFIATVANAQAATWSADSGQSLFQSLGITVPSQEARSQIVLSNVRDFTVLQTPTSLPANFSTRHNLSVSPPSTDSVPVLEKMAGPSSAPPPSASFVPQIAQQGGGADPILMAQMEPIETVVKSTDSITMNIDVVIPASDYWGNVLTRYIHAGTDGLTRFDYAGLKASKTDTAMLGNYIDHMAAQIPSDMPRDDAMAYWANLYNALTVQVVAENYPVKSIRKIKSGYRAGPWKRDSVVVEGRKLSLDDIEHNILRPTYQTPLVHYMVNCASVGCPNLKATPWQAATLAADQEDAARAYINSPRGAIIKNGRLQVSSIYKWFDDDFGGSQAGVIAHLSQYADADLRAALESSTKIDKYTYDWDVNAPR